MVAGPACGAVLPVPLGRSSIGRGLENHLVLGFRTVSRSHARLEATLDAVTVLEAGAANDTVVDGAPLLPGQSRVLQPGQLLQLGSVALRLRRRRVDDRPHGLDPRRHAGPTGTVPFNRPPRPPRPPEPATLTVPVEPSPPSATPFGIATFVGGFAMAGLLVAITGQLRYAAFSAVMPFLAVGTWYEARRRARNGAGRANRAYTAALEQLRAGTVREGLVERDRLDHLAPDVGEVLRRTALPSTRLWERRPDGEDFLQVSAGVADLPWRPPLDSTWAGLPERVAVPARRRPRAGGVGGGGPVARRGRRHRRRPGCRPVRGPVAAAAGRDAPGPGRRHDRRLRRSRSRGGVGVGQVAAPHPRARPAQPSAGLLPAANTATPSCAGLLAGAGRGTSLVVLDSAVLTEGRDAPARDLLQAGRQAARARRPRWPSRRSARPPRTPPAHRRHRARPTRDRLPGGVHHGHLAARRGRRPPCVTRVGGGPAVPGVLAGGVDVDTARACARDLAPYEDPELHVAGAGLPAAVRLLPLLELDRVDGAARPASAGAGPAATRRGRPDRGHRAGPLRARPGPRRRARPRRRHHRLRQERAAAQPRRGAGRAHRPGPPHVRARRLQGRRRVRRLRAAAAHRRAW